MTFLRRFFGELGGGRRGCLVGDVPASGGAEVWSSTMAGFMVGVCTLKFTTLGFFAFPSGPYSRMDAGKLERPRVHEPVLFGATEFIKVGLRAGRGTLLVVLLPCVTCPAIISDNFRREITTLRVS